MAGWTSPDREVIEWDGTIKAKRLEGDGSKITGISATGGSTLWTSGAEHIYPIVGTQIVSGAGLTTAGTISGAIISLSSTYPSIKGTGAIPSISIDPPDVKIEVDDSLQIFDSLSANSFYFRTTDGTATIPSYLTAAGINSTASISGSYLVSSGNVSGAYIEGDGSRLRNLPSAAAGLWTSNALFIYPIVGTQVVSGAGFITDNVSSAAYFYSPGLVSLSGSYQQTSAGLLALSGAYYTHIPMYDQTSGNLVALSGANSTSHSFLYNYAAATSGARTTSDAYLYSVVDKVSGAWIASYSFIDNYARTTSGARTASDAYLYSVINHLSGAYVAHAADSSDPHGVTLTQTRLVLTSGAVTADITASAAQYIPVITYNKSTSAGMIVTNYPIGSLMVIYAA